MLRRRDRVVKKVKSTKYWPRSHKYGFELPKTVTEVLASIVERGQPIGAMPLRRK